MAWESYSAVVAVLADNARRRALLEPLQRLELVEHEDVCRVGHALRSQVGAWSGYGAAPGADASDGVGVARGHLSSAVACACADEARRAG